MKDHLMLQPDIEVKGNVRFDLQFVVVHWLKYTFVRSIVVLEQLVVQKTERKGDGDLDLFWKKITFRPGRELLKED